MRSAQSPKRRRVGDRRQGGHHSAPQQLLTHRHRAAAKHFRYSAIPQRGSHDTHNSSSNIEQYEFSTHQGATRPPTRGRGLAGRLPGRGGIPSRPHARRAARRCCPGRNEPRATPRRTPSRDRRVHCHVAVRHAACAGQGRPRRRSRTAGCPSAGNLGPGCSWAWARC